MDPYRFTTLAHATHVYCNPVGEATLDRFIEALDLAPGARVLDVGCGKAELLIRIAARWGANGAGVDVNPGFLLEARAGAESRGVALALIEAPVADAGLEPASFDLACCVGSTHAFGERDEALAALRALVRPGGQVLFGHGHWMRGPDPEYLASFGGTSDELDSIEENLAAIDRAGLERIEHAETTLAEWDAYETRYAENIERFFAEHPDDPDREAFLARSRGWKSAFDRWGRGTMGFAIYRLRRPTE